MDYYCKQAQWGGNCIIVTFIHIRDGRGGGGGGGGEIRIWSLRRNVRYCFKLSKIVSISVTIHNTQQFICLIFASLKKLLTCTSIHNLSILFYHFHRQDPQTSVNRFSF